jgi:hypothetical protein
MVGWFTTYWPAMLAGLIFGTLFSPVSEFSRRLIFSAVLFLITYKVVVNVLACWGSMGSSARRQRNVGDICGLPRASCIRWNSSQNHVSDAFRSGIAVRRWIGADLSAVARRAKAEGVIRRSPTMKNVAPTFRGWKTARSPANVCNIDIDPDIVNTLYSSER